ncbi:hypothetical protein, partial [Ensifer sp. SSB1]|uniref:hypothetical protein n=1 Tax=Ensifer sp. SSB1 TaxID=2795385 RepID=UPI0025BF021B
CEPSPRISRSALKCPRQSRTAQNAKFLQTASQTAAGNGGRFFVGKVLTVKRQRFMSTNAAIITITNVTAISHGTS